MRKSRVVSSVIVILSGAMIFAVAGGAIGGDDARHAADTHADHIIVPVAEVQWKPGPESLPSGAQYTVLEGDPASQDMFTMRLRAPAGYRIPPHTHPKVERVTVLQGTFRLGTGRQFDEQKMQDLRAGSFFVMPPGMEHFAMTGDEETIVQLTGQGPWGINYINPQDDPRRQAHRR